MLAAWLERLFSTCPAHLREMGYLREMVGIRRRWARYPGAWQPHCEQSSALILAAADRCPHRRRAVVLGSGWLHDVPLAELSRRFDEVVLVDLFHPLACRLHARRYRNVHMLAADVTGAVEGVWQAVETPGCPLPRPEHTLFRDDADLDLTISLNLLSQLPCMPERYLRACGRFPETQIGDFSRALIRAHLDYLPTLPGVVALIADHEVARLNRHGKVLEQKTTLYGVMLPWHGRTWTWTLVPPGRTRRGQGEILTVVGIEDVKTAARTP